MTARFSPDRKYRYELWRWWDHAKPYCMFIGLNPSTADETRDDPTIRRCIGFAKAWGFGGLCMANLFAFRATDPKQMLSETYPHGPENEETVVRLAEKAGIVIAAWGKRGAHLRTGSYFRKLIPSLNYLRINSDGSPQHPLYIPKGVTPIPWSHLLNP